MKYEKWVVLRKTKTTVGGEYYWHIVNACGLVDTKEEALAHVELEKEHDLHWPETKGEGYKIAKVTEFQEAV